MSEPRHDPEPGALDLPAVLAAAWRERVRIVVVAAAAALLALGVAFLLPKWYRAQAVILPPDETDLLSNLGLASRALSKFPALGVLGDYFTPADLYRATLRSRTAREFVADRFELDAVYRKKSREKTLKELERHTEVKLAPDGTITVSVEDRDPRRAAGMAMAYLEALDRYNIEKRNTQARRTRAFLERRVAETDSLMRRYEARLRTYMEARKTVAATSLSSSDVQAAADVMARKLALEVRLGVLRSYLRDDNDQVVQARTELDQLSQRIATLPALQTDLTRMTRDFKVQEQLFLLLTAELEQARIREMQDTPTISVLDPAIPPERHSRPRRLLVALAAGALAFLGGIAWAATRRDPDRATA